MTHIRQRPPSGYHSRKHFFHLAGVQDRFLRAPNVCIDNSLVESLAIIHPGSANEKGVQNDTSLTDFWDEMSFLL